MGPAKVWPVRTFAQALWPVQRNKPARRMNTVLVLSFVTSSHLHKKQSIATRPSNNTMVDESGSNVTFTPDTKGESIPPTSIEEGVPHQDSKRSLFRQRSLSYTSRKYDVDGDGKLDEAEQAMRAMDKEGLGYLTNDKVYHIFQQQLRMQNQLLLAKRLLILFAVLLVILSVANIGVAFAAAKLAKDTKAQNNVLVVKDTGEVVATNNHADIYVVSTALDTARRNAQVTIGGTTDDLSLTTVSQADAASMYAACSQNGVSVTLKRTWAGFSGLEDYVTLCPGLSYSQTESTAALYTYVLSSGRRVDMDCSYSADSCLVYGDGVKQLAGEPCVFWGDCLDGSFCVDATQTAPGTCKLPIGVPGCLSNNDCTTGYCDTSQGYNQVGTCACNLSNSTDSGCEPGKECYAVQGSPPLCLAPEGFACYEGSECLNKYCVNGLCA